MYNNMIPGWMSQIELQFLYDKAKEMESIVEIGSYKGKSTKALLEGCKGQVIAIDTWEGSSGLTMDGTEYEEFLLNTYGHDNLVIKIGDSVDRAEDTAKVDMVFIDGDHTYEGVKRDIEAWLPKARKLICGHDYDIESVKQAVDEKFPFLDGVEGSIWFKYTQYGD